MKKTMIGPRSRTYTVAFAAAALLAVTVLMFMPSQDTETEAATVVNGIQYFDDRGNLKTQDDVTVIAAATDIPNNKLTTGWYIVRGNITISNPLIIDGRVELILGDGCNLNASKGIRVHSGLEFGTLAIYEQPLINSIGILKATGDSSTRSAGIGGATLDCGNITIAGGNITATGAGGGAGIGGGNGKGGNIHLTIAGGNITATGSNGGAGIGAGNGADIDNINIRNGTVTATGAGGGAGIGGGNGGLGGTAFGIIIRNGTVTATGAGGGAGIGGGNGGGVGFIDIHDGDTTAKGSNGGAGIGGGNGGGGGSLGIFGGTVNATGSAYNSSADGGAGIGGGATGPLGSIYITGGNITAVGGSGGAGIGGGSRGSGGTITITGGNITANGGSTSGLGGAGIGGGSIDGSAAGGNGGNIAIHGGDITTTGGNGGAGIGGGSSKNGTGGSGGNIAIHGGDIRATGFLCAIGGGWGSSGSSNGTGGTFTANGGNITAICESTSVGAIGLFDKAFVYGDNTHVTLRTKSGAPSNINGTDVFVILPYGNFIDGNGTFLGNKVQFTAVPTSTDTVKATLPSPFNTAGVLDVVTGLDKTGKAMSITTTLTTQNSSFALAGSYTNSPITKTGTQLNAAGASVDFRYGYSVNVTIVGGSYGAVDYTVSGGGASGTLPASGGYIDAINGSNVTLTCRETSGKFVAWSGAADSVAGQVVLTSTNYVDIEETVTFAAPGTSWNLKLFVGSGGGSATVEYGGKTYTYEAGNTGMNIPRGNVVKVSATPPAGSTFAYWYGDENISTPSFSIPSTNTADREYGVRFVTAAEAVTISFASDPAAIGAKYYFRAVPYSGTLPSAYGNVTDSSLTVGRTDTVYVSTDPAVTGGSSIHTFIKWTEGANYLTGTPNLQVPNLSTGAATRSLTAVFTDDPIDIIFASSPTAAAPAFSVKIGTGSFFDVTGGTITVSKSDSVAVRTSVPGGYEFLRWKDSAGKIISNDAESGTVSMSSYDKSVTFTAMFATSGNAVTVTLGSDPSGATLYYKIGTLTEVTFSSSFKTGRSETLTVRASPTHNATDTFLRWENSTVSFPGVVMGYNATLSNISMPSTGTAASYTAVYQQFNGDVQMIVEQKGGTGAAFEYVLNGVPPAVTYTGPVTFRMSDTVELTASVPSGREFIRWQDSEGNLLSTTANSGTIDLSGYGHNVTFTAVYAATGEKVTVDLNSDPSGATPLKYTIEGLLPITFSSPFPMERSESLEIEAPSSYSGLGFAKWIGSDKTVWGKEKASVSLPSNGDSVAYTAVYAPSADILTITLSQTTGARATLMYNVNGDVFQYAGPFTALRTDAVSAEAADIGMYEFLRWYDSEGNVISKDVQTGEIDLSVYTTSTVALTAVFTAPGNKVMVSMLSDPEGADLFYKIGSLNQIRFTEPFAMGRNETLQVDAPASHAGIGFLRWEGPAGVIGNSNTESGITMPASGTTATYKAVYVPDSERITITLVQTSGAGAALGYTLNNIQYTYGGSAFDAKRSDTFALTTDVPTGYEFLRWRDSATPGAIISTDPTSGTIDLSSYGTAVTFTAMFETTANVITVSLVSDAQGASLSYGIDSLGTVPYAGPFKMGRSELLTVNASPANGKNTFVRWEDSGGIIGSTASVSGIAMPASGNAASYKAVYALPGDQLTISLGYTGASSADLEYALNGQTFTYSGQFTVIRSDTLTITASTSLPAYGFLRWTDSDGNIVSETPASGNIQLYAYYTSTVFTAAFALSADIVTVTLDSDPTGADLFYSVGQLNETMFTASFRMARSETLNIIASTSYSGEAFARWESQGRFVDDSASISGISMSEADPAVSYTALYVPFSDLIEITLDQTGGANAVLEYILNDEAFPYSRPFKVIKSDTLSVSASVPSGFEFIRWQDSDGNIVSETESSGSIDLSEYDSSVTLTAVFSAEGDKIWITLESDPPGASLHYIIGSLKEIDYTGTFAMSRNETLSIHSAISHEGEDFVRWLDSAGGIASYLADSDDIDVSGYGEAVTFTAVFAAGEDIVTVALASDPAGSAIYFIITSTETSTSLSETRYTGPFKMIRSETLSVRAGDISGKVFDRWEDSSGTIVGTEPSTEGLLVLQSGETETFTAYFIDGEIPTKYYYINAKSDQGSTISPSGKTAVPDGTDQTFTFQAKEGYVIAEVIVDGRSLSQQEIDRGSYTFRGVYKNSTIEVKSTTSSIVLVVSVVEGKGYAEYSLNGGNFVTYSAPVPLQAGWSVMLRAYADDGYSFKEWRTSSTTYTTSAVSFPNIDGSVRLSLYFSSSEGDAAADGGIDAAVIIAIAAIIILAALFLMWWLFFFRRSYAVTVISEATVRGKERARRKRPYSFSVEGASSGTVSYKVGEEGQWKTVTPGPDGKYVIPGKEIVDHLMIEHR